MRKKHRKLLLLLLLVIAIFTTSLSSVYAQIDSSLIELSDEIILAENHYTIPINLTDEFIAQNRDLLTNDEINRSIVIVNVSWLISYTSADGLAFYTTATGSGALLKRMVGMNYYTGYGSGAYEIRSTNWIPFSRISNYVATGNYFPSGTILECSMWVDIDAINEISGGYFSANDIVTIP